MNAPELQAVQSWIVVYLLNSIWQLPLVFAAAWMASRLARPAGPLAEHRVWVAALLAGTMLPACQFDLGNLLGQVLLLFSRGNGAANGQARVILGPISAAGIGLLHLPSLLITGILIAYGCALIYFATRLIWGLWKTRQMLSEATPIASPPVLPTVSIDGLAAKLESNFNSLSRQRLPVYVAVSPMVSGPVALGLWGRVLLLPPGFLENVREADLDAVLAHEAAHTRRRDFAKNLLYSVVTLPIAWHPMLWLTLARLAETREMVCDEIAANALSGREPYAHALLRLASTLTQPVPTRTLHAIGIFDANIFERRIMKLSQKQANISPAHRIAIAAGCAVLAVATCASALALHVDEPNAPVQRANPKSIHVKADSMKLVTQVNPVYPSKAKIAHIQGSVVLAATIGKDGSPEYLKVQTGPSALQESALDAVRQWRWQPYLLNGDPIEVETTVTVVYELGK